MNYVYKGIRIFDFWAKTHELKTLELDILNPDYLIRVSNGHTFDFLLKSSILGYCREKSKTGFFKFRESLPFLYIDYINLKWRTKF